MRSSCLLKFTNLMLKTFTIKYCQQSFYSGLWIKLTKDRLNLFVKALRGWVRGISWLKVFVFIRWWSSLRTRGIWRLVPETITFTSIKSARTCASTAELDGARLVTRISFCWLRKQAFTWKVCKYSVEKNTHQTNIAKNIL